ncbi:MAG: NADH-quinone oxidoreductase subunit N [Chloroflexi bacterium]|nr:NADH-quinone oxidoreductase subunit N [Chloroflexota bacterium]
MNYLLFLPEFLLVILAFVVMSLDLFLKPQSKAISAYVSAAGLLVVMASVLTLRGQETQLYGGLFLVDGYALFFKFFFLALGIFIVLTSADYVKKYLTHPGEYYGIILFSVLGMMVMTAAGELLTAYIGLELLSFSLYVLSSYATDNAKSNEAGTKYILLGALSTALLLYGLSLIYGLVGTTSFEGVASALGAEGGNRLAIIVSLVLVIAGFGIKIAAVPFHMWAPDVYEGSPLPITAYISVASKAAGFALALRIFAAAFLPVVGEWRGILIALSALTMTVGNLVALAQKNIKRLLAYSSIGQSGYLLMGLAAVTADSSNIAANGILLHLAGYGASNLAAFVSIIAYFNLTGKEDISDFAGLAERAPLVALTLSVALFSLAGLPFFAGFTTKFYLFTAAAREGLLWLVTLAVVNSLISLYYYLMVIKQMYINPPAEPSRLRMPYLLNSLLVVLIVIVFIIGIYPAPLVRAIEGATRALFLS